ncbi:MAG: deoxyribodipyrimidine photo-lyase [Pseudomonadota bacterium]
MTKPILWWVRRDLRLRDNEALTKAAATGRQVIPVFIRDAVVDETGAAPKWRWGLGLEVFAAALRAEGSQLVLRTGHPLQVLRDLIAETGSDMVYWNRLYDPGAIARDTGVKAGLTADGVAVESFVGHVLFEPWTVQTKTGGYYKVYTPMWRAVQHRDVASSLPIPKFNSPSSWPEGEKLSDWGFGAAMQRGAEVVKPYTCVGEEAALMRLDHFLEDRAGAYKNDRDFPGIEGTSRLSENLAYGEISSRRLWHAGKAAAEAGAQGAETFVKEVVWREFAYHLMYHQPTLATAPFRPEWAGFPWRGDNADADAWRKGLTGCEIVDAAMRELYVTGTMHNRCRMIVGSYLTKHLLTHWRVGLRWFAETLIDWDPASNAIGWQWIAGCGPDATPYFRVFNPDTQADKFDGQRVYRDLYLRSGQDAQGRQPAADFYKAIPVSWGLSGQDARPKPRVDLKEGRQRALAAYHAARE